MTQDDPEPRGERPRDAAIEWWLRRANRPLSPAEQEEFDAWRAVAANRAAFADIADMCGHLAAIGPTRPRQARYRRRAAAAAALLAASLFLFAMVDDIALWLHSDFHTGAGETRRITLEDGSHVELDARSAIAVRYARGERRLALLAGEAWFEVAPDAARPFVVEAAGGEVTALGTAFDVSLTSRETLVTVTEHKVAVASGGRRVTVAENQQSAYSRNGEARPPSPANVERATAWRRGRLMFENERLGDVIAALSRYRRGWIYFARPALRERRVTGLFGADDPSSALEEIELSLGLHALRLTDYLIVIYD
jgi:transmembrane sensor